MSLDSNWAEPKTNSSKDRQAAELYLKTHVSINFISLRLKKTLDIILYTRNNILSCTLFVYYNLYILITVRKIISIAIS